MEEKKIADESQDLTPPDKSGLQEQSSSEKPLFLMSTDSFSNSGLDLIFELTKNAGFDWIDLAIWKNFDAWNVDYVKKLSKTHDLPIKVVQVSDNVNQKELNKALDICEATGADTIAINAPTFFNLKAFNFLVDNLDAYKKENEHIHFSIINPEDSSVFALPIPKYRFSNLVEIIKKYWCYLGLDISHFDAEILENEFIRKLDKFLPYVAVLYFSDKPKDWSDHLLAGEGILKLEYILKKIKETGFGRYFSTKINIAKNDLADSDKLAAILKKARKFYEENYEEVEIKIED